MKQIAKDVIDSHLTKVTAISAITGIPGGLGMAIAIPGDVVQFYWHALVLAQKLAYIYGWDDLLTDGKMNERTKNELTMFMGVMFGVDVAHKVVAELSKRLAIETASRLSKQSLTKTIYYPIIKKIARYLGYRITKDTFGRGVSKVIPFLGAAVSGGVTYVSFKKMSKRLQQCLEDQIPLMLGKDQSTVSLLTEQDFDEAVDVIAEE